MNHSNPSAQDERKWQAIRQRLKPADQEFYYGVVTTGIYCRPGCSARAPKRENVVFFDTRQQAERQGYRPCRKCRPELKSVTETREQIIIAVCRRLETDTSLPTVKTLASEAGLSPFHFHRLFRKIVGITPRQYYLKHRADRLRRGLDNGSAVAEAIFRAGFGSLSGAYNSNDDRLAMAPKTYRQGGEGVRIVYGTASCYLGIVLVAATERGICSVELGDSEEQVHALLAGRFPQAQIERGGPQFSTVVAAVVAHFDDPSQRFDLPLDIQGTAFQQKVWETLRRIEPGTVSSYSAIAEDIGRPSAVRAVARACAANSIAILIPCHRVLTKDRKISGYRWGKARKRLLLEKERK